MFCIQKQQQPQLLDRLLQIQTKQAKIQQQTIEKRTRSFAVQSDWN